MSECTETRLAMLELLQGRSTPGEKERIGDHAAECEPCDAELTALRQTWRALPDPVGVQPPAVTRESVLAYALSSQDGVVPTWETLAAGGGFARGTASATRRAVLFGALGALGGYWALSVAVPVSDAVGICGLALFGVDMSIGQVCVAYLIVAALYAGIPLAIAAYLLGGSDRRWRMGLAEAVVFMPLVAPLAIMQSRPEGWMITATLLGGLLIGSLAGGLLGSWVGGSRGTGMAPA